MNGTAPQEGRPAFTRHALTGGHWATPADIAAARALDALVPGGAGRLTWAMYEFHRRAALWAVTEEELALPAQAVIFTAAGIAPRGGEGDRETLHGRAAEAAPGARFCYVSHSARITQLNRAFLARADPARVCAVLAREDDPDEVLARAEAAGTPAGVPVSVHVLIAAQRWTRDQAVTVLSRYRELLAPGSSVCLTAGGIAEGPEGDRFLEAVSAATGRTYRHTAGDLAAWVRDAGMTPHPAGVTDVRGWQGWARDEVEAACPVVRVLEVVGITPF